MRRDKKKVKSFAIVDCNKEIVENILGFIQHKYDFKLTTRKDAEYVFHSVHGYDVLKYSGVRIFISGECVSPNFAISDYAMTFDKLSFGDRYIWLPLIKLYRESYSVFCSPRLPIKEALSKKTDFCAYVMSNTKNSSDERTQIFDLLSAYKPVNSGGQWRNNIGGRVRDKIMFQSRHKFVIAFENFSYPGYITEKFAEAAASDAVPIYWGDPQIGSLFNPKAFINCHDFSNLKEVADRVTEIDKHNNLYEQMLTEPWFLGGIEPKSLRNIEFTNFLSNIFDQDVDNAYRRNRGRWGRKKELQLNVMWAKPHIHSLKLLKKRWREIRNTVFSRKKKFQS